MELGTRLPSESQVFVLKGKATEKWRQRKLDGGRNFEILKQTARRPDVPADSENAGTLEC